MQPLPLVDPRGATLHLGGVLLGGRVEQGHLALAAAPGGRADLLGVGLGLPVGVLQDGVGLGVGGFEHPAGLGAGGGGLGLRGGGLGPDGRGGGLGVVDGWDASSAAVRRAASDCSWRSFSSRKPGSSAGRGVARTEPAQRAGTEEQTDEHQGGQDDDSDQEHPVEAGHQTPTIRRLRRRLSVVRHLGRHLCVDHRRVSLRRVPRQGECPLHVRHAAVWGCPTEAADRA